MALPYFSMCATKNLLDLLSERSSSSFPKIVILIFVVILVSVLSKVLSQVRNYIETIHSEKLMHNINKDVMYKTIQASIELYDSPEYLDTMQAIMTDSYSLSNITWNIFYGISNIFSLIVALIMIGTYNFLYAILLIVTSVPAAVIGKYFSKSLYNWRIANMSSERQQNYIQSISSDRYFAFDIRLHDLTDYFITRYIKYWNICFKGRALLRKKQILYIIPAYILPELMVLIFIIKIIKGIVSGQNSLGDFTLYMGLFGSLIGAVEAVINSLSTVYEDKLRVDTVKKFEHYEKESQKSGKIVLTGDFEIEFKNVSFHYPKSDRYVLKKLSFKVESKTRLCILGVNGSGKSTIIKLLLRFYDVTEGEILINSVNIKEYTLESLRRSFSVIFQDYINYAFTLRENVLTTDVFIVK